VEIAQVSGLSPATVTRNIAYLMTVGVLAEDTTRARTEGRSRIPVTINASYGGGHPSL
jgi:Fic family protein